MRRTNCVGKDVASISRQVLRSWGIEAWLLVACSVAVLHTSCVSVAAESPVAAATRRPQGRQALQRARAYKTRIVPHWFANNTRFWYRNELPGARRAFVVVDAVRGTRNAAFDHKRLAAALRETGVSDCRWDKLPIDWIEFEPGDQAVVIRVRGHCYRCELPSCAVHVVDRPLRAGNDGLQPLPPDRVPRATTRTGPETELVLVNQTDAGVKVYWLDTGGRLRDYGSIAAGARRSLHTFAGHIWKVIDSGGKVLAVFETLEEPGEAVITGSAADYSQRQPRRSRSRATGSSRQSPDGHWTAAVENDNIVLRATDGDQQLRLTKDGTEEQTYSLLEWAPDSKTLVAYRVQKGEAKEVYLIESSPAGGGRARLRSRPYALPGDRFASYELNLFDIASRKQIKPEVDRIDFGRPRLHWSRDGRHFTYAHVARGHQRFRLMDVCAQTGAARTIIDERSKTFIWTAHTESRGVPLITWLSESDQFIYASERDGWQHLYLGDAATGALCNQITRGSYVVRGIEYIDEAKRQIWFCAGGMNPTQDPYFKHYYRINFDGTQLVPLTAGDGNHSIQWSPDRRFVIDRYSRVDMAPVHELRRADDGTLVCRLESADISELQTAGWQPPEVFVAKGRDGKTDIWGLICRPTKIDPQKKYPILEDIYAGPHGAFVPKSFSSTARYADLAKLGFIIVKIDGMGTAFRSKAFHDVCWQNLKDAGLPDRIRWIRAAAKKYPYMDIDQVGIYGTSAGGQSAAAAVLFHGDFYKAAAAFCGCHDNRMDKASWNEQWMGYPVGPQYAANSNIENAHRLTGHLLLEVGELDTNVPPESTMRFVDALIRADKDFELLVVPGAGHGNGGAYGRRRMRAFFQRYLADE